MLLFKRKFLDAIRRGEKTQTLRNWKSQRLKSGQKDSIPGIGPIWIDSVEKVSLDDLTDADAIPDGFSSIDALKSEIRNIYGDEPDGSFYRVRFHLLKSDENEQANPRKKRPESKNLPSQTRKGTKPEPENERVLMPQSRDLPEILNFVDEIKQEFSEKMTRYLRQIENQKSKSMLEEPETLTEAQVVEKMVRRCRINRNVCDWNHEPGKSQDFFSLFLRAPRDERGAPTLDGYRLRSLMRDLCTEEQWEEICWIATEICSAWTEWQYAIEHWLNSSASSKQE